MTQIKKRSSILYVEDDETLSFVTCDNLTLRGYAVDHCTDGQQAFEKFAHGNYDLCIFDVMLPKLDGFSLARKIREKDDQIPIIFLTAKSSKDDKIEGLTLGADDYITKPYSMEELILKIEIFLKRSRIFHTGPTPDSIVLGTLIFDTRNQELISGEEHLEMTHKEAELLQMLAASPNTVIKREEILLKVWGNDHFFSSRSLDVFISRLRKMISRDPGVKIENIHNVGYKLILPKL